MFSALRYLDPEGRLIGIHFLVSLSHLLAAISMLLSWVKGDVNVAFEMLVPSMHPTM